MDGGIHKKSFLLSRVCLTLLVFIYWYLFISSASLIHPYPDARDVNE